MLPTVHWNRFEIVSWLFSDHTSCRKDNESMRARADDLFPFFSRAGRLTGFGAWREKEVCVWMCTHMLLWNKQWAFCGLEIWELTICQVVVIVMVVVCVSLWQTGYARLKKGVASTQRSVQSSVGASWYWFQWQRQKWKKPKCVMLIGVLWSWDPDSHEMISNNALAAYRDAFTLK